MSGKWGRRANSKRVSGSYEECHEMGKMLRETVIEIISPPFTTEREQQLLGEALRIRRDVFITGQQVHEKIERDGLDPHLIHFILYQGRNALGCLRFHKRPDNTVKLERIAVLEQVRGLGYGKELVTAAVEHARTLGYAAVTMHAQYYLLHYYRSLGFSPVGEPFLEADIRHIEMVNILK